MDRKFIRKFTHLADNFLTIDNTLYKQWVFRYTFLELGKDLFPNGDITTNSIFHEKKLVKGRIIAKENGILAGVDEIKYFLVDSDPQFKPSIKGKFNILFKKKDGNLIKKNDVIMEISADVSDLLAVERTVLNLLIRMSSVATFTKKIVNMVKDYDVLIAPTRKTLWGLLDKKAVLIGGGGTHRINLSDAILIKDSHLNIMNRNYNKIFQNISKSKCDCRFIEVEAETINEVLKISAILSKFIEIKKIRSIGIILMDNMKASDVAKAMKLIKENGLHGSLLFEASGGITEENVVQYAKTGVDIISMGCLTTGIGSLDMGMEVGR